MSIQPIRFSSVVISGAERFVLRAMPLMGLMIGLLAFSPLAQACGGGGSGSYRKPPRPDHHQDSTVLNPPAETPPPAAATSPAKN